MDCQQKNILPFIKSILLVLMIFMFHQQVAFSQNITGKVLSADGKPLPGAMLRLVPDKHITISGNEGEFSFSNLPLSKYSIEVTYTGFEKYSGTINPGHGAHIIIELQASLLTLQEVLVTDHYAEHLKRETSLNVEIVNSDYIRQNLGGSLMHSLERLPGVGAFEIGQGQAKPVIRGLGFNRVIVVENNIKHEGQQWGSDHGLEIDQFAADRVGIIKGPASLTYGSDAIGGVIQLSQVEIPAQKSIGGSADFMAASNNQLLGTSAYAFARKEKLFFTVRATLVDFADYRVPADSIEIYSYRAALDNKHMRNTAGKEQNIHLSAGFVNNGFSSRVYASRLNSQNGFFANAHGLEPRRVDTGLHDVSNRDIQYPFHKVTHYKLISKTNISKKKANYKLTFGAQRNLREERSQYVGHGYMPAVPPPHLSFDPDLERAFDKQIYSGNVNATFLLQKTDIAFGISSEYQNNRIDGRGFIIPAFTQLTSGAYAIAKHNITPLSILHAGIRADYGQIEIEGYSDWFPSPNGTNGELEYAQRAEKLSRQYSNFTWAIGANHNPGNVSLKINAGKSFRMPTAKELAANGVNYHRFSYEKGDPALSPEISYQLDAGFEWNTRKLAIGITPYANYFTNYIYLNPDYRHDHLYGNGNQIFNYTQSRVFRYGGEFHGHYNPNRNITLGVIGEYIFAQQLSGSKRGFTLPFSPPALILLSAKYAIPPARGILNAYIAADMKITAAQNRIVPPEIKTPGYNTLKLSAGGIIDFKNKPISLSMQVSNLLNKKYFNHTSYYRLINIPEPGRNFTLNVYIPINKEIEKHIHKH